MESVLDMVDRRRVNTFFDYLMAGNSLFFGGLFVMHKQWDSIVIVCGLTIVYFVGFVPSRDRALGQDGKG